MAAGHGGISGRYERWREAAFQYAWLLATADSDRFGKGAAES
jgi:oligopeptidase B